MFSHDHFEFLENRLFDKSADMLDNPGKRDGLYVALNDLRRKFDFEKNGWPGREKVLLTAHKHLYQSGVDGEQIALVLAVLDGGISVIDAVEKNRAECLEVLEGEKSEMEDDKDSYEEEDFERVDREIAEVRDALFFQLFRRLKLEERHATAPFEGAYVRMKKMRGGKNWDARRRKISRVFGITERAVGAAKAWESPSLSEKGGGTVDELVEGLREKVLGAVEVIPEPFSPDVLKKLYELFSDARDLEFLKKLEPSEFYLVDGNVSSELRQWIYAVAMLVSPEKVSDVRKLIAEGLSCSVIKVAAVTAYLTGKLRESTGGERLKQIDNVEKYIASKSGSGAVESDPNYDNEAKNRGWREPMRRMIERAWGKEALLKGRRMLILDTPRLLEWNMLKSLGGEEKNLTIVERDSGKVEELRRLLPEANIVSMSLQDWLTGIFQKRTVGMRDELSKRGFPVDGAGVSLADVSKSSRNIRMKVNPSLVEWMRTDPRFAHYGEAFRQYLDAPYFLIREAIDVPSCDDDMFDLVSLDTTSRFAALRQLVEVVLNLEILGRDGVLCTNCVGQREIDVDKNWLAHSLQIEQVSDFTGRDWVQFTEGSVSDLKVGVSLALLKMVSHAADQYGHRSFCNTSSPFFNAVIKSGVVIDSTSLRTSIEGIIRGFGKVDADGVAQVSEEELISAIKMCVGRSSLDRAFRLMARKLFRRPFVKMDAKHQRTLGELSCVDSHDEDSTLVGTDAVCEFLAGVFVDILSRRRLVHGHEAFVYRGGSTNMLSDFFYAPTCESRYDLPVLVYQKMVGSVLSGKSLTGVKGRFLLDFVLRNWEQVNKCSEYRRNVGRVSVKV